MSQYANQHDVTTPDLGKMPEIWLDPAQITAWVNACTDRRYLCSLMVVITTQIAYAQQLKCPVPYGSPYTETIIDPNEVTGWIQAVWDLTLLNPLQSAIIAKINALYVSEPPEIWYEGPLWGWECRDCPL